jgi:hypothetical protein
MTEPPRRFPSPWHIYSRENAGGALQAKVLTKDEARRIAANIARLPDCREAAAGASDQRADSSRAYSAVSVCVDKCTAL